MATLLETYATPFGLAWQDSSSPAAIWPNGGTAPAMQNFTSANIQLMQYGLNDLFFFQLQLQHGTAGLSDARIHVHFTFPSQPTAGRYVKFELIYSIADINGAFGAESAAQTNEYQIQATDNKYHRVLQLAAPTLSATPQSNAIIGRIRRIDATSGTESNVSPMILFVDAHVQMAGPGTEGEFA
jgi:hypothetical protein